MLHIFAIISFLLLQSSCYKLYVYSGNFSYTTITQMSTVKRNKKSLVKIVEHKLEEAFFDSIRDVQLGRFILLSVPISQQHPRLT